MNKFSSSLVISSLLLAVGCSEPLKKLGKQIEKSQQNTVCFPLLDNTGDTNESDHDIKFYAETIELVRDEVKFFQPKVERFWISLTEKTREKLLFELNIYLLKNTMPNPTAIYRGTAFFFTHVKNNFKETTDYKFKDTSGALYSYSAKGKKTEKTEKINFECNNYKATDLRNIPINYEVYQLSEIKDAFECRTDDKQLFFMEIRDRVLVSDKRDLYSADLNNYKKSDSKRSVSIRLDSKDIQLNLKIKKKREADINGIDGNKSTLDLKLPTSDVEGKASCDSLKRKLYA